MMLGSCTICERLSVALFYARSLAEKRFCITSRNSCTSLRSYSLAASLNCSRFPSSLLDGVSGKARRTSARSASVIASTRLVFLKSKNGCERSMERSNRPDRVLNSLFRLRPPFAGACPSCLSTRSATPSPRWVSLKPSLTLPTMYFLSVRDRSQLLLTTAESGHSG